MITIQLKKAIAAVILASVLTTTSVFSTNNLVKVNAAEIKGEVTVQAGSLWTYNKADWSARTKIVNSGEKFILSQKITVDGREMYGLTNGLYITANPQYVEANESVVAPKPPVVQNTYKVTLYNLNLRKGIGTSHGVITTMPKGSKVQVLRTSEGWSELNYNGTTGWASSEFLGATTSAPDAPKEDVALPSTNSLKTTTANLSMRQGPSTNYARVTILPKGTQVESVSTSNGWDKIIYQGKTGYVSNSYLTTNQTPPAVETPVPTPPPTPTPPPAAVTTMKVTTYNLSLRQGPSTSYDRIMVIPKGSQVESSSSANGWDKITYQGMVGYVASTYLNVGTVEAPKPVVTVKYTTGNLSLRTGPSTSNTRILVLPKGSKVESSSSANGWDQVTYLGTTGYASSKYLTTDSSNQETKVTGQQILDYGKTFLGIPYTWGGNTPTEGFDCSGLIKYVYAHYGYSTPRVSYQQAAFGKEVSMNDLQLGDILYFGNSKVSHVGIYAGNNTMLHAPRPGQFVEIRDISWHVGNYDIVGARRYLD